MRRLFLATLSILLLSSCQRLGWGILLWSAEEPPIPSGTVLPVYIRSNIDQVWVVGVPGAYRNGREGIDKIEVPLAQFELAGSRRKAEKQAAAFARYALTYAETLQDGLPIREDPDNGARRVYRLRTGEIIKILARVEGNPAISATGDPLPGDWYRVLTAGGTTGYCFSYRLKLFEHSGGPVRAAETEERETEDPDLELLLSKTWSPEAYGVMLNNRRISLEDLSAHYGFFPGLDTGEARIYLPGTDRIFAYTGIRALGGRSWVFENGGRGPVLQAELRSETLLALQYNEEGGARRTLLFTALPQDVDDLILQETARRDGLFGNIYSRGPAFTSNNYGTINFRENKTFSWTGYDLLVPQVIPPQAAGGGSVAMDLFIAAGLQERYHGAFSLRFAGPDGPAGTRHFLYTLDAQGFRLEYVPETNLDGNLILRRTASPVVLYFFQAEP
jgi:hypothetical protein